MPPFYYKNPSEEGLFKFYSELIDKVADSSLRLYLYHYPFMSTVPIPLSLILRLKGRYGDVIEGLKDSSGDWSYTERVLKEIPGFKAFSGSEDLLLQNLRAEGPGCISATTNVTSKLARRVADEFKNDNVESIQIELQRARKAIQRYPLQAAVKAILAKMTDRSQWRNILPPNMPLSEAETSELMSALKVSL